MANLMLNSCSRVVGSETLTSIMMECLLVALGQLLLGVDGKSQKHKAQEDHNLERKAAKRRVVVVVTVLVVQMMQI